MAEPRFMYLLAAHGRAYVVIDGIRHPPHEARTLCRTEGWSLPTIARVIDLAHRAEHSTYVPLLPDDPTREIKL